MVQSAPQKKGYQILQTLGFVEAEVCASVAGRVHVLIPVERSTLPSLLGTVQPSLGTGGARGAEGAGTGASISATHIYQPQAVMQVPLSCVNWRENELEALFFLFFLPPGLFLQSSRKLRNMPLLSANKLNYNQIAHQRPGM